MALEIEKKFLDQAGVSTLWSRIADAIAAEAEARDTAIGVEKDRAMSAELALADSIGTIPEGSEDVISYVNKKTQEVLDAATGGSQESAASVKLQLDNYKTENDPKVAANTSALATLNGDATTEGSVAKAVADEAAARDTAIEEAIGELEPRVAANEGKITTLIGDDTNKSVRTIANEELAKQLVAEDAKESLDTLAEIAAWIQAHPDDASAMNEAITALQNKVDTGDKTVSAYVTDAIAALSIGDYAKAADLTALAARVEAIEKDYLKTADKTELSNAIDLKAAQADLEAEAALARAAEKANADAIAAIKDDANIDSFADVVTELAKKQDNIPENTYDAYGSASAALTNANSYTDGEIAKIVALSTAEIDAAIEEAKNTIA